MNPTAQLDLVRWAAQRLQERLEPLPAELLSSGADSDAAYERLARAMDACLYELAQLDLWGSDNRLPSSELVKKR